MQKILSIIIIIVAVSCLESPTRKDLKIGEKWRKYLYEKCIINNLNFKLCEAVAKTESYGNPYIVEKKNGKIISVGLYQAGYETLSDYCWAKRIKEPKNKTAYLLWYPNNIDIFVWFYGCGIRSHGHGIRALSEWNLGAGYYKRNKKGLSRRNGIAYYKKYIDRVEKNLRGKIE